LRIVPSAPRISLARSMVCAILADHDQPRAERTAGLVELIRAQRIVVVLLRRTTVRDVTEECQKLLHGTLPLKR
jgi:hypothetical protein